MSEQERAILRTMHEQQRKLFQHHGKEIEALRRAIESLHESHKTIAGKLPGVN